MSGRTGGWCDAGTSSRRKAAHRRPVLASTGAIWLSSSGTAADAVPSGKRQVDTGRSAQSSGGERFCGCTDTGKRAASGGKCGSGEAAACAGAPLLVGFQITGMSLETGKRGPPTWANNLLLVRPWFQLSSFVGLHGWMRHPGARRAYATALTDRGRIVQVARDGKSTSTATLPRHRPHPCLLTPDPGLAFTRRFGRGHLTVARG